HPGGFLLLCFFLLFGSIIFLVALLDKEIPITPGLGIILFCGLIFLIWWLKCKAATLTVTNFKTVERRGLISKNTSEILHSHIRNIGIKQGFFDRLLGVGGIYIAGAGTAAAEIVFPGLKIETLEEIKKSIDKNRN
ncbi:MAG: PH domain-containing protein, partial [Atribacterota bacterium]